MLSGTMNTSLRRTWSDISPPPATATYIVNYGDTNAPFFPPFVPFRNAFSDFPIRPNPLNSAYRLQ